MALHIDWVRDFCRILPHTTEDVQWGALLFRIARKIYCTMGLEPESSILITFKCTPEKFAELVETEGFIPAPYAARNHWVAMTDSRALRQTEVKELIRASYQMVFDKLPKKTQAELSGKRVVAKTKTKTKTRKPETRRERRKKI